ncbi:IPT/TIG domain-containing protein [Rathayibacter oskolensis]|uniref:IPT/TIG domain-containing protein n=1 Tax=Rathayibacter oskolensis TaxID=1891671 RepID=A0A1X7NZX3_9MICO|nr:glycosyl hydrolase [Rathayibacter oskolensis]SMH43534.1 IPT/TIG domain-containing protein [Rathayibacter oskolensis]
MSVLRSAVAAAAGLMLAAAILLGGVSAPASAAPAAIALSPSSGPGGTTTVVTGTGFAKRTTGTVTAGAATAPFTTSTTGSFAATITIPATATGTLQVTARAGGRSVSAAFIVTLGGASTTAGPGSTTSPAGTAPAVSTARLRFGLTTPGGASANAELDRAAVLVGESPALVLSYQDFGQATPLTGLDSVAARGATSILTWEPWRWGGGVDQPAYSNARILAGDHDPYLRQWGAALAAWGEPVLLRYAHEMNGDWYPWSEGVNGNAAGSYAEAWRHVHDVVAAQGATNVSWVWSPNVPYSGSTPLQGLYPGAAYVDVVALDGYNWGTSAAWSSWTSPSALFGPGLTQLRALAPGSPILVAETASAETGGAKSEWNAALVSYLSAQSDVTGFVWFDHDKEVDWRIASSTASAQAFAAALAQRPS